MAAAAAPSPPAPRETPERILEAALEVFSQQGFDGARTRDIASQAGVRLGLLQYHFGSKEDLWRAAVTRAFDDLEEGFERDLAASTADSPRERLRALIRGHAYFVAKNTAFIRIMHDEGKRPGPRMQWLADRYVEPLYRRVTPTIIEAQACGVLVQEIDPAHFVYTLLGAVGMFFHQAEECKRVTGLNPTDPATIDAHIRVVESLFLGDTNEETS